MAHPIEGHPIRGLGSVAGHVIGRRGPLAPRHHSHDSQCGVEDQIRRRKRRDAAMKYKREISYPSDEPVETPLIAMPFFYSSGEEIRKGDRVLLHGEPSEIELVADPVESPDDWLVKEQGGGVMVLELNVFGRLFISEPETDEHLTFLSRHTKR
jgi:hypothetical protein